VPFPQTRSSDRARPSATKPAIFSARVQGKEIQSARMLQRAIGNQGVLSLTSQWGPDLERVALQEASPRVTQTHNLRQQEGFSVGLRGSAPNDLIMRSPDDSYVSQINVDLNSPQNIKLDWHGTPPDETRSTFRCSTGKGYGDPDDPPGICNRPCCNPGANPCESPYDQKKARGSCCTPIGDFAIQSKEKEHAVEGGTIPFWMYFYSTRGIALHEYRPVDGTPLSHGCVRLDSANAEMLFKHSRVGDTKVKVSGNATPACPAGQGVSCAGADSGQKSTPNEVPAPGAGAAREETDSGA